jgi:hypothetical protein
MRRWRGMRIGAQRGGGVQERWGRAARAGVTPLLLLCTPGLKPEAQNGGGSSRPGCTPPPLLHAPTPLRASWQGCRGRGRTPPHSRAAFLSGHAEGRGAPPARTSSTRPFPRVRELAGAQRGRWHAPSHSRTAFRLRATPARRPGTPVPAMGRRAVWPTSHVPPPIPVAPPRRMPPVRTLLPVVSPLNCAQRTRGKRARWGRRGARQRGAYGPSPRLPHGDPSLPCTLSAHKRGWGRGRKGRGRSPFGCSARANERDGRGGGCAGPTLGPRKRGVPAVHKGGGAQRGAPHPNPVRVSGGKRVKRGGGGAYLSRAAPRSPFARRGGVARTPPPPPHREGQSVPPPDTRGEQGRTKGAVSGSAQAWATRRQREGMHTQPHPPSSRSAPRLEARGTEQREYLPSGLHHPPPPTLLRAPSPLRASWRGCTQTPGPVNEGSGPCINGGGGRRGVPHPLSFSSERGRGAKEGGTYLCSPPRVPRLHGEAGRCFPPT